MKKTNLLLQEIYKCATGGVSSDGFVKKVLGEEEKPEKKLVRPPSASRNKKTTDHSIPSKKSVEK